MYLNHPAREISIDISNFPAVVIRALIKPQLFQYKNQIFDNLSIVTIHYHMSSVSINSYTLVIPSISKIFYCVMCHPTSNMNNSESVGAKTREATASKTKLSKCCLLGFVLGL